MAKRSQPKYYQQIKEQLSDFAAALDRLGIAVRKAGPLDEKTIQLAQLCAAAAIRSEGAVLSHTRRALEAGATAAEVRHAVLALTSTIGFPNVVAALSWIADVVEGEPS